MGYKKTIQKNINDALIYPKKVYIKSSFRDKKYNLKNLTHKSNVAVFPELGIAFNRIKKSGNTTIGLFLIEVTNKIVLTNYAVAKEGLMSPQELPLSDIKKFPEYFSFVIVRDPYTRALSTFLQKLGKRQPEKYKTIPGSGNDSREGFLDYLRFLEEGGLYVDRHFWPQVDLLYQPVEQYSYVGKLESLVTDMRHILSLNKIEQVYADKLSSPHELEKDNKSRITSAKNSLEKYYTEEAKSIVSRLYSLDFKCFNYSLSL